MNSKTLSSTPKTDTIKSIPQGQTKPRKEATQQDLWLPVSVWELNPLASFTNGQAMNEECREMGSGFASGTNLPLSLDKPLPFSGFQSPALGRDGAGHSVTLCLMESWGFSLCPKKEKQRTR